ASAATRADSYLADLIDRQRAAGGDRLPTIRQMASAAGVSTVTMWKCVSRLSRAGVLTSRPRRGIRISGVYSPPAAPMRRSHGLGARWQRIASSIAAELAVRNRPGDGIPSVKELSQRFGADPRTVRRALAYLVDGGHLIRDRRRFRVPLRAGGVSHGTVGLIARADSTGRITLGDTTRSADLHRAIESECSQLGTGLSLVAYGFWDSSTLDGRTLRNHRFAEPRIAGVPLGYAIWSLAMSADDVVYLASSLSRLGRPVVVIDETAMMDGKPLKPVNAPLCLLSFSDTEQCGRAVGHYLLEQGHRRVAYICPYHGGAWTRRRVAGIRQVFVEAGVPDAVRVFADEQERYQDEIEQGRQAMWRAWDKAFQHNGVDDAGAAALREVVASLTPALDTQFIERTFRAHCERLFAKARKHDDITAWVGSNDRVALAALEWLARRRIAVPERLSVIGFDDSAGAYQQRLTSYNFDCRGIARTVVARLTARQAFLGSIGRELERIEPEGFVNVRTTSGPARPPAGDA
ncbi:MAG: GntR family transcriptional regulator, partial [Chitinivibrionales bacterium]|nr:GntR family transcriptional regulator [Chitinivibrionales bacterium]